MCDKIIAQSTWTKGRLQVSANGHFLQYENGEPFFWLGDTGWELFSRLKKEEIETYLENRRQKGFNVIQAVIIANTDKPLVANQYGDLPLDDNDPAKPNEHYLQLVDWSVKLAMQKQMFIGLLPTWGGKVMQLWAKGDVLFNEQNAYAYGLILGKRYKDYPNIIWIAGGDRPGFTDSLDARPVWRAMIKGIREGSENKALITYHPWGEHSSSEYWQDENTIDINMLQSGHARQDVQVWEWIRRDYNLKPARPIVDGEPNYEDHPINWKPENGYFRDYDVRKQLYRSVFSGACGVTYGHQAVWQFYSPREEKIVFPDRYWTDAINRPGAYEAGYLKELILSRPPLSRVPDQSIVIKGQGEKGNYITAFRDEDSSYAMVYLPVGKTISVQLACIATKRITAWWFNPKTSKATKIGMLNKKDIMQFTPPTTGVQNDWVLVIDANNKHWKAPGML